MRRPGRGARRHDAALAARVELSRGDLRLDVELQIGSGEVVALVGPNGAGKTTLLRALAGLQPLHRGRVVLDGRVFDDTDTGEHLAPEHRRVGVVFQDHLLFAHLDALDNVAFGLRSRGASKADSRARAATWLDRVDVGDVAHARPAELSGGQAQRVALARALAPAPRLLLLDEPFAALDATARPRARRDLRRHLDAHEGVHLVVTHDPLEAMALADTLVVLEHGQVTQAGTAADVAGRPRSRYVADLVGVNLLRGRASGDRVELAGGGTLAAAGAGAGAGEVFAVVHPRAVALHRRRPEGTPRNVWPGTVETMDVEGSSVRARVAGPVPIVAEVTAAAVADLGVAPGVAVWVTVKASEVTTYPA